MSVCSECHKEFADTARFCPFCGAVATSAAAVDPYVGKTVAGKFLVEKLLGQGGMGKVYLAHNKVLDQKVVLKVLHREYAEDADTVKRFQHEGRAASRLRHPNVIQVLDFGAMDDGTLFMAMEYLPGQDLAGIIQREFPLGDRRIIRIGSQILSALSEAHAQNVIHRDLKPENVMVEQRRGEPDFVKVLDFGIAKITDAKTKLTAAGLVCGTPEYMSPEQARGADLDSRSDLYSVGVILYQMVTGLLPFESDTPVGFLMKHLTDPPMPPSQKQPEVEVPPELEALIMRALSKSPDDRFANAEEMRAALIACAPGEVVAPPAPRAAAPKATPPAPARAAAAQAKTVKAEEPGPPAAKAGGRTVVLAVAAAVIVVAGAAGAFFATRGGGEPAPAAPAATAPTAQAAPAQPAPALPAQPAPVEPAAQPGTQPTTPTTATPTVAPDPGPTAAPDPAEKGPKGRDRRQARLDPDAARGYMKQGDALRAQLDCGGAIPLYLAAEAADPELAEVQKKLAICYQSIGDTKKAVKRYQRYLKTDPDDAEKVKLILSTLR